MVNYIESDLTYLMYFNHIASHPIYLLLEMYEYLLVRVHWQDPCVSLKFKGYTFLIFDEGYHI